MAKHHEATIALDKSVPWLANHQHQAGTFGREGKQKEEQKPGRLSLRRLLSRLSPATDFSQLCLDVQLTDAEVAEQLCYPHP